MSFNRILARIAAPATLLVLSALLLPITSCSQKLEVDAASQAVRTTDVASQPTRTTEPTSPTVQPTEATLEAAGSGPSGVLTFSMVAPSIGKIHLYDYDIATRKLTDYGEGEDGYRCKSGAAVVAVHRQDNYQNYDLVVIDSQGKRTTVVENQIAPYFVLSPDGSTVVYRSYWQENVQIDGRPRIASRNGIAFTVVASGKTDNYRVDVSRLKLEPENTDMISIPEGWAPNGDLITTLNDKYTQFQNGKSVPVHYFTVNVDGGKTPMDKAEKLATWSIDQPGVKPITQIFNPRVSPDGKYVVFQWEGQIWRDVTNGSNVRQVTNFNTGALAADWSPDSNWIAVRDKYNTISLVPMDGKTYRENSKNIIALLNDRGQSIGGVKSRVSWR